MHPSNSKTPSNNSQELKATISDHSLHNEEEKNDPDGLMELGLSTVDRGEIKKKDRVQEGLQSEEDQKSMRRLVWKFDITLLPVLTILYLFNALDKGNLSNAKTTDKDAVKAPNGGPTNSFSADLHLKGNQWTLLVMIFYVPFCLSGPIMTLIVKRFGPARVLPILAFCFGATALLTPLCTNFSSLFAIRWFLGIFESPILAGVIFYLSTFYRRNELAGRLGIFYGAASIASGFSGLISFGVFRIRNTAYSNWMYLFWVEGGATVIFAILAFFILPGSPSTAKFLTPRERELAIMRIQRDSSSEIDEKLNWKQALKPLADPRMIVWAVISFSFGVPLASVNNFSGQLSARLGYGTIKTNLFTVFPSIVATVFLFILTQSSDYFRERSFHIVFALSVGLVGWIMMGTIDPIKNHVSSYVAVFFVSCGAFAPSVLVSTWYSNNTASESKRALIAGCMVALANSAGLISTNVFRTQDAPKYQPAVAVSATFSAICLITTASWGIYQRWDNRRRDRNQGDGRKVRAQDVDTALLKDGWKSPEFRWVV